MKQGIVEAIKGVFQRAPKEAVISEDDFSVDDIIARMQFATLTDSEQELAQWLNIDIGEITRWKIEHELPLDETYTIGMRTGISMGWIISGDYPRVGVSASEMEGNDGVLFPSNGHVLVSERGAIEYIRKRVKELVDNGELKLTESFQPMHYEYMGKCFYDEMLHKLKEDRKQKAQKE